MASANPTVVEALTTYYPSSSVAISEFVEIAGYQDAQRFQKNQGVSDYGPLVAAFTGPTRRTITDFEQPNGAVVAVVEVYGNSHSMMSYKRLGLNQRTSATQLYCIWLHHATNPQPKWEAAVRLYSVDDACDPPTNFPIDVTEGADAAASNAEIPVGVRFVDDDDDYPAIGVVCLLKICEIGTKKPRSPNTAKANPQGRLKTWHDEQNLGQKTSGNPINRSTIIASITPEPGIKDLPGTDWEANAGVKAATIAVSGAGTVPAKYNNWNLQVGHSTALYIRKTGIGWAAQFVLDGGPSVPGGGWIPIARKTHTFKPEGMARWVWDENDESAWVACEQGCCEITQDTPVSLLGRGRGRGAILSPSTSGGGRAGQP